MSFLTRRSSLSASRWLLRSKNSSSSSTTRRWAGDMPTPQSSKAELWEGHSKIKEGWETTIYLTYGVTAILLTLAVGFAPESSIQTWARAEAQARLDLPEDVEVKFGTHYSASKHALDFEEEGADNPFNEEDEDDDDDDEEDDEDDDDE